MRKNYSFKWEPNWLRHYSEGRVDQGKVLDNYCHVTPVLRTLCFESYVITIAFFLGRKLH